MKVQYIEKNGNPEFAVLPFHEYQKMLEELEELRDIQAFDEAVLKINENRDDLVPSEVVYRILDGANPIRVWREYRQMTLHELAKKIGTTDAAVSQIETGKRDPSVKLLKAIAGVLLVDIDEIA